MPTIASALLLCLLDLPASPSHLRVDIVFEGLPMLPRVEASAMKEVTQIWAPYGVDVQTLNPNDAGRDGAVRLSVLLADHKDPQVATDALGSILFLDDSPEPAIVMYPNAMTTLLSRVRLSDHPVDSWPSARRDLILGRVLGRALAHEIGHFLLRSRRHSAIGLMRAQQSIVELIGTRRHNFILSADEMMRLLSVTSTSSWPRREDGEHAARTDRVEDASTPAFDPDAEVLTRLRIDELLR